MFVKIRSIQQQFHTISTCGFAWKWGTPPNLGGFKFNVIFPMFSGHCHGWRPAGARKGGALTRAPQLRWWHENQIHPSLTQKTSKNPKDIPLLETFEAPKDGSETGKGWDHKIFLAWRFEYRRLETIRNKYTALVTLMWVLLLPFIAFVTLKSGRCSEAGADSADVSPWLPRPSLVKMARGQKQLERGKLYSMQLSYEGFSKVANSDSKKHVVELNHVQVL